MPPGERSPPWISREGWCGSFTALNMIRSSALPTPKRDLNERMDVVGAGQTGPPLQSFLLSDELMTRQTLAQGFDRAPRIDILGRCAVRRIGAAQRIGPQPRFRPARDPAPQHIEDLDGAPAGRFRGTRRLRTGGGGEDPGRSEAQPEEDHQDGCSAHDSHDRLLSGRAARPRPPWPPSRTSEGPSCLESGGETRLESDATALRR